MHGHVVDHLGETLTANDLRMHYDAVRARLNPIPKRERPRLPAPPPAPPEIPAWKPIRFLPLTERHMPANKRGVAFIVYAVCQQSGFTLPEFYSRRRDGRMARARFLVCLLASKLTEKSLLGIGRQIKRDHTTGLHAIRRAGALVESDPDFERDYHDLETHIKDQWEAA